jgi:hypothetical protein
MHLHAQIAAVALVLTAAERAQAASTTVCGELARHGPAIAAGSVDAKRQFGAAELGPWVMPAVKPKVGRRLILAAAKMLDEGPGEVIVLEPMGGGAWHASHQGGSANCETDVFFRLRANGAVEALPTPAHFHDLCWIAGREIALIHGRPVLVETAEEDHPELGTDFDLATWRGDHWDPACQISIRWGDRFTVLERFCDTGGPCEAAARLAPTLAERLARDPSGKSLASAVPSSEKSVLAAATRLAETEGRFDPRHDRSQWSLPTFGRKPATPYPEYSDPRAATLVELDGHTYVARVGIGGIGWRPIGDYLVSLYRPSGDGRLQPVAGVVVERSRIGEPKITVETPIPATDN